MTAAVAIVTVGHNSAGVIDGWLDAIHATGLRDRLELCVVDSGSTREQRDRTRAAVDGAVDAHVALENVGFGRACNAGARSTSAPVLVFTNPDTRIKALPERLFDATAVRGVILGGVDRRGTVETPLGFAHLPTALWEARQLLLGRFTEAYELTADAPAWVSGAALAIARADFDAIGGFSPAYFLYFEDADLCARHRARGGRVEVDRSFVVEHLGHASSDTSGLDTLSRLSGRTFAALHGHRLDRPALFLLLTLYYVPRRVAMELIRGRFRRSARRTAVRVAVDLLRPARVLRRLGVPDARRFAR